MPSNKTYADRLFEARQRDMGGREWPPEDMRERWEDNQRLMRLATDGMPPVTPGDLCPACGRRVPMSPAERQRKRRERKKAESDDGDG